MGQIEKMLAMVFTAAPSTCKTDVTVCETHIRMERICFISPLGAHYCLHVAPLRCLLGLCWHLQAAFGDLLAAS